LAEAESRVKRMTYLEHATAILERSRASATLVQQELADESNGSSQRSSPSLASNKHPPAERNRVSVTLWERFDLFPFVSPNPRLVSALQSFAKAAGLAVSLAGALVLAGWALDITVLKSISSGFVSMKPNVALAFVLAGATLHVLSTGHANGHLRFVALASAFAVALVGMLTLSEYLYGWNLNVDGLLFSEPAGALGTSAPARMAPTSALSLFLIGVSLLVLDVRRCYPLAQLLTLVAALVSLTAFIGYVYGVGSLYGGGSSTAMALHSSLCFLLLSSGILLTRQDHGLLAIVTSDAAGGVMARRLLPAAILIPLLLGWVTVLDEEAGLHGPAFGVFLVVIWSIVSFAALTWWNSGSLYRLDVERQRAQDELTKGEAQLAEAQRIARVGSAEWDIATNAVTWSDEMFRTFGYEPGEVQPGYEVFLQRVHPDDRDAVEQNIAQTLRGGEPFAFDYRIIRPDGAVRMAHGEGKVVRDEGGEPVRLLGTSQDITERKQIEYALRQNEMRTRSIIDTANDAFVAIDAADVIKDWNPQAELTFGWTREEAMGRNLAETIIPPAHREAHLEGLHRYVLTGEGPMLNRRVELEALHQDGHRFPVEMTISPIRWGRSHIFSAFVRDITERKQVEEALARQTRELTRINSELEDFTHSVSHDLKEPLRGIEAFAGFIGEDYADKLDEQGQRYVKVLRESAVRMKDLIDDLLQLSRIGRTRLEQAPVGMSSLVQDVSLELSFALQEKRVELRIDPDLPTVPCDRARMREVFKNLISNAVKYNDKPQPKIEIGCRSDNGAFTFAVRDNGIGIAPEYHEKIFKIFQRLHHREEYEGTGVGLAICKKVVEAHGGRIWVESAPGEGTTFLFTMPRTAARQSGQEEHEDGNYARAV
jgi:PAS domain S-box-containing protein